MEQYTVFFAPDNKSVEVDAGKTIAEAAEAAGVFIKNLCGGEGVCGQCRVRITKGDVTAGEAGRSFFSEEELAQGYVLACQTEVNEDLEVLVPPESRIEDSQILTSGEAGEEGGLESKPLVRKFFLDLPEPTVEDNVADIDRIARELRKKINWHTYDIPLSCLQKLSDRLRENDWKVTASLVHVTNGYRIQRIEAQDTTERHYGLAVDVGTTTIVAQLVDLNSGNVLGVEGNHNRQASYGEDVISRMIYACNKGGLPALHEAVVSDINELIEKLTSNQGISPEDINAIVAAGNTTMSHLLLGLTPCSIRLEPYVPTVDVYPQIPAREIGIRINSHGVLEVIPGVASYVGGDIVAGVMGSGIADRETISGLIDIGTNGEIAIGNNEWLVCCSASAGPAFEGGGTRCGMRATKGAIEKIELTDGRLEYRTIGNAKPRGICGSGLIDCIYEFVKNGVIDPDGKFDRNREDPRFSVVDEVPQYVVAYGDESESGNDLVITESDIDNLMKSKGAVFAAIKALSDYIGIGFEQIDRFYVAGGFGSFLNIPKAIGIGLLPDIEEHRLQFIGNSSLTGARLSLLSENAFEKCINISRSMTNIELSIYPPFMDEYIAALFLPHTDKRLFPSVHY